MLQKNDEFELTVTGFTAEGSGVGRKDGETVFVENAAAGDVVLAHVIKAKKTYAVAKTVRVLTPSPDRVTPACPVFDRCGGCVFGHVSYEAELRQKEQTVRDAFARIGGLTPAFEPICPSPRVARYRNKAEYPVRSVNGELTVGFYARRTHRVIGAQDCLLQPEEFAAIVALFRDWAQSERVTAYDETTGEGLLRHLYLRKGFATGEIAVCPVLNGNALPAADALIERLKTVPGFATLCYNVNTADTNVVLGRKTVALVGDGTIADELCGLRLRLSPASFYQVNRDGAELLYRKAAEYADLHAEDDLLDLYCGTGTVGLSMARCVRSLIGVEIVPDAVEDAKRNAARNGVTNAEFLCADAAEAAATLKARGVTPRVVLLDPPRKGCAEELLHTVAQIAPERVVYISCDPATLARDCARFSALGYTAQKAAPVDMFPRTGHVETVVLLSRN